jgi:hypothetical protein
MVRGSIVVMMCVGALELAPQAPPAPTTAAPAAPDAVAAVPEGREGLPRRERPRAQVEKIFTYVITD